MRVYIKKESTYYSAIRYVLKIIEKSKNVTFEWVNSAEEGELIWDHTKENSQYINLNFYELLKNSKTENKSAFKHGIIFRSTQEIKSLQGEKDVLATIFYMINCLQELVPSKDDLDAFGRFKYDKSYQNKYDSIENNLVQNEIDVFCMQHNLMGSDVKSSVFVSHDIDTIYGSFFQDGFWALKHMNIGVILNLIFWEITRRPHWKNMDQIMKINSEYDIRSTFFWLVNKGKGLQGILNADYSIAKEKVLLDSVERNGFVNGLHKSSSAMSLNEEISKSGLESKFNRYHFLNFLPHRDWDKLSESNISLDGSLGFAERYGFRNSYGKAFQPFDINADKPFDFVEAPLNFMDCTFHKYMKVPTDSVGQTIIDFYEKNPVNCDFSLLWHNTYFTNYKYGGFLKEYKKVLSFFYENKVRCVSPQDLINENRLEW